MVGNVSAKTLGSEFFNKEVQVSSVKRLSTKYRST